jgi:hypothetical protein
MGRLAVVVGSLVTAGAALAGTIPSPVALPRPAFPPPAKDATPTGPRLVLVSSTPREPAYVPPSSPARPEWAPLQFHDDDFQSTIYQGNRLFLLYGPDAASGRYLVRADRRTQALVDAYDFRAFARPPRGGWFEPVMWAREAGGVLYVSNSHLTYASRTKGRNAYVSAIDLARKRTLWRSPALVANGRTFVVTGDVIVSGYGFTRELDFLYLLDRRTGRVLDRLALPTAPEVIRLQGGRIHVRTYDHDVVARIAGAR